MDSDKTNVVLNGRYRLTEKIGRGGMAEVWTAQDTALSRTVAIKIMLPEFSSDPSFSRRFKQEAAAAANLSNPYIVNIYDWGQEGTTQYIVMEYVPGNNLKDIIQENGPLPQKKAAKLGVQVCQALDTAHHQDIIHRDIKPQNIMVQPNGDVKVMDFGIARPKNSTEQKTSTVLGTAHYVSPEQAQGKELTAASDIYSLGIVLYEAVTGRVPFDGEDALSVALKQVEQQPMPPSRIVPNIDPRLEEIIMRALRKNPADRFASALDMARALEGFVSGRRDFSAATTQVINPVNGRQDQNNMQNKNTVDPAEKEREEEEARKKKRRNIIIAVMAVAIVGILTAVALVMTGSQTVTVPDVAGKTFEEAVVALEKNGLEVGQKNNVPSADIPEGCVISTDPKAGVDIKKGSKINIDVSSGKEQVQVPDLSNLTEDQAIRALESAGLKGTRGQSEFSTTVDKGKVISQDPRAGETVDAGETITYSLSDGADNVAVPNLSGMTEEEALKALEELGLKGLVGSHQASDTVKEGTVISQNPASGIKVESGTQITFTVSTGLADVTVPSLMGLNQSAARSTLINAGLALGEVSEKYSDEPQGTVIEQSVADGTTVKKGDVVDIVISKGPEPKPENTNTNGNSNANGNANTNSNANRNVNTNANSPVDTNEDDA